MDPLLINFTPTGMLPTKQMTPHVPISTSEIVEQVHEAAELGITIAHLHARDPEGRPTYRSDAYGPILEGIRQHVPELILCVSLSGRRLNDIEKRADALSLTGAAKPDMGSLSSWA
jgi:uncharacterized protein (DUF849 family)